MINVRVMSKILAFIFGLLFPVILSITSPWQFLPSSDDPPPLLSGMNERLPSRGPSLQYDFYREKCSDAEKIVFSAMRTILSQHKNATAQLLRLLFHDCFIQGCDASVLLDDNNGKKSHSTERQAIPNKTLKGFDFIDTIKEELESTCPGVVSCADILVLATRDGIALSGGPFYPVYTGRRDSMQSFFDKATSDIPRPDGNINETLRLFSLRGFDERETVILLGAHSIGKIDCEFIRPRLSNFLGTGQPDPSIPSDFLEEMRLSCQEEGRQQQRLTRSRLIMWESSNTTSTSDNDLGKGMTYYSQTLLSFVSSGAGFDTHYYRSLVKGRGLLFADQQLMADSKTAKLVRDYAVDDGTIFRMDFARAMIKMSNLGVLAGSQGEIRYNCSMRAGSQ